eukprot:CAMPEP_0182459224 /NCGR_PEP_ID=MMETSP1319-20130603/4392_1 /TAXON_ID=172717 /ORGANISM="Bolidomonas pacifica, Strain RCC208" /LENGTH=106 /DNA_ID=CAMNT_0024658087 /DNA_START=207 /DNA_END=527 /DNA_ORIENTATION=-
MSAMPFRKLVKLPTAPLRFLTFLKATRTKPHTLMLEVPPRLTKHEIGEHLTAIYGLPRPWKVNTSTFRGVWKRIGGKRRIVTYQRPTWKKAFVMWKRFDAKEPPPV